MTADVQQLVIDSRGQRKVEEGSTIVFVGETGLGADGWDGLDAGTYTRMLIKLH